LPRRLISSSTPFLRDSQSNRFQVSKRFDEEQLDSSAIVQGFASCCGDVKPCVRQAALDGIASM
jgi:hypothetical protein